MGSNITILYLIIKNPLDAFSPRLKFLNVFSLVQTRHQTESLESQNFTINCENLNSNMILMFLMFNH